MYNFSSYGSLMPPNPMLRILKLELLKTFLSIKHTSDVLFECCMLVVLVYSVTRLCEYND
jgi:hypothetical protein